MKTCLQCQHFSPFYPPSHGECFRFPPTPFKDGTVDAPKIKANRRQCGEFLEIPDGATAQPVIKANVPSHGLVTKKDTPAKSAKGAKPHVTTATVHTEAGTFKGTATITPE